MKERVRTFVAVPIHDAVREAVGQLVDRLRAAGGDVKWVRPENWHLTIQFLGDVDSRQIDRVCGGVEAAVADQESFELAIQGVGGFPDLRRPRTVWLGVGAGAEPLCEVAGRVAAELGKLGFRPDRPFHPHLTIGRVRRGGAGLGSLAALLRQHQEEWLGRTRVSEVVTFSSRLDRSGPTYEPLGRARLRGA